MNQILPKILLIFSKLPLRVLYALADVLYFLQRYLIKYRSQTVKKNLRHAFPEKNEKEIHQLQNQFYKHLCDLPVESIKALSITQEQLNQKISYKNLALLHQIKSEEKNLILLAGHIFNWEWLIGLSSYLPSQNTFAVYHPSQNKTIDALTVKTREKFGSMAITMRDTPKKVLQVPNDGDSTFLMISDQKPHSSKIRYDIEFLNQNTPVFIGYDKLARKRNMGVVYIDITKNRRGEYTYEFVEIKPDGKTFIPYEIVHKYYYLLEKNIKRDPANWLWSHNRWKYIKGKDY